MYELLLVNDVLVLRKFFKPLLFWPALLPYLSKMGFRKVATIITKPYIQDSMSGQPRDNATALNTEAAAWPLLWIKTFRAAIMCL